MRRVCAKLVPRIWTHDQKVERIAVATEMLRWSTEDPSFMAFIVTGDKSWVYGYDLEKKAIFTMESQDELRQKKAQMNHMKNVKLMLITFFDVKRDNPSQICGAGNYSECPLLQNSAAKS